MHLRAYSTKNLEYLLNSHDFSIVKLFSCSNNHSMWGQVRNYNIFQNIFFSMSGLFKMGNLLIGISVKNE